MIGYDKFLHAIMSGAIAATVAMLTNPFLGLVGAMLVGVVKEMWDMSKDKHGQAEAWKDIAANFVGAALGAGFVWLTAGTPEASP